MSMLAKYEEDFVQNTKTSARLYERARTYLPGGVAGNNKFMIPHPLYIRSAQGAKITDVDGNEYIDLLMGAGPLILGHRPPAVTDAITRQLTLGAHFVL